jgi:organic radical activating enzyme
MKKNNNINVKKNEHANSTGKFTVPDKIQYHDEHTFTVGYRDNIEWDLKGTTFLSGWSINPFSMTLPDFLICTDFSGRVIGTTRCETARKDIAEAYLNENVLRSGWKIIIPKFSEDPTKQEIKVYAYIAAQDSAFLLQNWTPPIDDTLKQLEDDIWLNSVGVHPPDKRVPYYSCNFIEGSIVFGRNLMLMCCAINLNSPDPYDGICMCETNIANFSIKALLQKRSEVITENQKGGYSTCKGCQFLRKKMWPVRGDLFNYLNIGHDASCNLKCKYCNVITAGEFPDTTTDEVLQIIKTLNSGKLLAKNMEIMITGGEPAMVEGLENLLSYLTKFDYNIYVFSNGTIFSQALFDALKTGNIKLVISVDTISDDTYLSIKGKKFCRQVWKNIDRYAEENGELVIPKMIIMKENIHEIDAFIQRCIKAGVTSVCFDCDQNNDPDPEIINGLRQFDRNCREHGIIGIPATRIPELLQKE